jgi:hypothetical protein
LERVKVGHRDAQGRMCTVIASEYVLKRSRQAFPVAVCYDSTCTAGKDGAPWRREGLNAMGTGSRHAAAYGHLVVVTREMVTEFDGKTPRGWVLQDDQ